MLNTYRFFFSGKDPEGRADPQPPPSWVSGNDRSQGTLVSRGWDEESYICRWMSWKLSRAALDHEPRRRYGASWDWLAGTGPVCNHCIPTHSFDPQGPKEPINLVRWLWNSPHHLENQPVFFSCPHESRLQENISGTGWHIGSLPWSSPGPRGPWGWTPNFVPEPETAAMWDGLFHCGREGLVVAGYFLHVAAHCQPPGGGYDVTEQLCHWMWAAHTHAHTLHTCQLPLVSAVSLAAGSAHTDHLSNPFTNHLKQVTVIPLSLTV